jgi:hypothetical protein
MGRAGSKGARCWGCAAAWGYHSNIAVDPPAFFECKLLK